ncbi:MAG: hypothetical protein GF417_12095 [Candidatus Latescibacteria bacterium]|nr:hypothetical protein [bacterium]MBD3425168.1 hypothetical protein [Candidatus Latescibacterota bacterium]
MDSRRIRITPLLWGVAFTALGVIELVKQYEIVYGIPVWALCFFIIAFNNFMGSEWVRTRLGIDNPRIIKIASVANIAAISVLILSLIVEFALS